MKQLHRSFHQENLKNGKTKKCMSVGNKGSDFTRWVVYERTTVHIRLHVTCEMKKSHLPVFIKFSRKSVLTKFSSTDYAAENKKTTDKKILWTDLLVFVKLISVNQNSIILWLQMISQPIFPVWNIWFELNLWKLLKHLQCCLSRISKWLNYKCHQNRV